MSYSPYTPPPSGHPPPTSTTYPYGTYHPSPQASYQHPGPGAYSYQPSPYHTGVTSYGWPYSYGYVPQHPQAAQMQRPPTQTPAPVTAHTTAAATAPPVAQRSSTFTSYTPTYVRETVSTSSSTGNASNRGSKRQSNLKGLFAKDLKSLMYGFGDDRNPANDTVNVMEEILVEYITDVCQAAGGSSKRSRLSIEDLRRALSRPADAKKLARLEELLFMQEDIKRARAQFEESDMHNPKE